MKWSIQQCRTVICLLKNYTEHAKEMQGAVPSKPEFFFKPVASFLPHIATQEVSKMAQIEIPRQAEVHHEVELGVVIGKRGKNIPVEKAMEYVTGFVLCLDMTARNEQAEAKKNGKPWAQAKGYDTFLPIGEYFSCDEHKDTDLHNLEIWLQVNGKDRQRSSTKNMVFNIPQQIAQISQCITLNEGDLILTGTPEGVGPVKEGDVVTAGITNLNYTMRFGVKNRDYSQQ